MYVTAVSREWVFPAGPEGTRLQLSVHLSDNHTHSDTLPFISFNWLKVTTGCDIVPIGGPIKHTGADCMWTCTDKPIGSCSPSIIHALSVGLRPKAKHTYFSILI